MAEAADEIRYRGISFMRQGNIYMKRKKAISRRGILITGAAAAALTGLRVSPARAVLRLDVTQGNVQPMPIAMPDFVPGTPGDAEAGAPRDRDHHRQPCAAAACSRRSIRPLTSRRSSISTRRRGFPTGARSMPRRWCWDASPARVTVGSRPSSGCGTCSAASSSRASNIPPRPTTCGASPTSCRMRSTSG